MQKIIVDTIPGFRMPSIFFSQGDVGTQFAIDLRSRFGDALPASPTITIQATKPSGFGFSVSATSVSNGVATFTTTTEMTDEAGRFPAELKVVKDSVTLYTANFYMDGEATTHPEGTIDGSAEVVIPELTQLVERVEDAASSVLDMTVEAETLAAGSQATYSYDEETNTATFGIPQGEAGAGAAGVTANAYSSSATYAVGDYVIHNSNLYRCTTAITTAEAFTAGHWTQVVLADDVTDLKSDLNFRTETIFDTLDREKVSENGWAVVAQDAYQQLLFDSAHWMPIKPYVVRLTTSASIGFTKIEFRNTSNTVVATISDASGFAKPGASYYMAINPTGTTKITRIRFYGSSSSATINLEFFEVDALLKANINAIEALKYISDFSINKASNLTWIEGKYVNVSNTNYPYSSANWAIANFDVKKGDLIIIRYPDITHMPDSSRAVLAERVVYGSGDFQYGFRVIYKGTTTATDGEYVYIAEKDMSITITGRKDSGGVYLPLIYIFSAKAYAVSEEFASERYTQFDYNLITNKLQIGKTSGNGHYEVRPKPLTLLHYSDVHNNYRNANNIKVFSERFSSFFVDDVICTGDMTGDKFPAYYPIYGLEGYEKILLCIGNHDVYDVNGDAEEHGVSYDNPTYWATNIQKYNQYFAPSIAEWGVTQPTGASTDGLCYYYKDYESNGYGYRLIVLDAMAFDDAQYNWLSDVLADAITNELTVVMADHFVPITGLGDINGFNTPFMSLLTGMEYNYKVSRLTAPLGSAVDLVDDFINDGGEFACWLCGHMHYDQIGTLVSHPNQIFIAVAAATGSLVWADMPRTGDTVTYDCFNIVSIDPYLKTIKVQRIGATIDDWGRMHDHVSVNYQTKTLIATS